jgi:hypothetical protein
MPVPVELANCNRQRFCRTGAPAHQVGDYNMRILKQPEDPPLLANIHLKFRRL